MHKKQATRKLCGRPQTWKVPSAPYVHRPLKLPSTSLVHFKFILNNCKFHKTYEYLIPFSLRIDKNILRFFLIITKYYVFISGVSMLNNILYDDLL